MNTVVLTNYRDVEPGKIVPMEMVTTLIFGHAFCEIQLAESRDFFSILLTCKIWNKIATSELIKGMKNQFFRLEKQLDIEEIKGRFTTPPCFDVAMSFSQLNFAYLSRLREIQFLLFKNAEMMLSNLKKSGLIELCTQRFSDLSEIVSTGDAMKLSFLSDFDQTTPTKNEFDAKAKMLKLMETRYGYNLGEAIKLMSLVSKIHEISVGSLGTHFCRIGKEPYMRFKDDKSEYKISQWNSIIGMATGFCTETERSLVLSEAPINFLHSELDLAFEHWEENELDLKIVLASCHAFKTTKRLELLKDYCSIKAISLVHELIDSGNPFSINKFGFIFSSQNHCYLSPYEVTLNIRDYIANPKHKSLFQDHERIKHLLKIAEAQLCLCDRRAIETLRMIPLPEKLPIPQDYKVQLNALFTPPFLNQIFIYMITEWQGEEKNKSMPVKDILSFTRERILFDLFTHLHKLLAFRYHTLEDVFAEDGLHCCFIKVCVAMDRSDIAEIFIHSHAIVDAQETYSAKKVKDVLMKYLISIRNAKTIYAHREYS